jgi:hypothetical protein
MEMRFSESWRYVAVEVSRSETQSQLSARQFIECVSSTFVMLMSRSCTNDGIVALLQCSELALYTCIYLALNTAKNEGITF